MKPLKSISYTGRKVVLGFFAATFFLIAVAGLTYITLNRLVASVEQLAQPNQKLDLLNSLQTEIFRITRTESLLGDVRIKDSTILDLESKLNQLDTLSTDSLERGTIQTIRKNLALLINGYVDLYEVKKNLESRNFSQEALRRLEIGIQRRAAALELEPLRELNPKSFLTNELQKQTQANLERQSGIVNPDEDRIFKYLLEFQKQNSSGNQPVRAQSPDSVLYSLGKIMGRIYREETAQRQELARIETDLFQKQAALSTTIQTLVGNLQSQAIKVSNEQSQQASGLVFDVTFFLIIVIVLAVLGTLVLIFSILREIRINQRYQEDLEVSRQKSEELARSKQEFLANMSHEIRNPLHVIQGYRTVLEKTELNPDQQSHLQMIGFASDTLVEIVDDILDFSKLEAGKLKLEKHPFDPIALFGSIQNLFELSASEKKLRFDWVLELPDGLWLIGDELRLKQVLNNLLSNAFKFTKEGRIEVRVRWVSGHLTVEVKDSGIGMRPQELEKVFQEFDQADTSISRKFGGTGLGLAIVQRMVNLMKGKLEAESELGKGTVMRIKIPVEATEIPEWTKSDEADQTIDLTGLTLLLVDDDRAGLRYLETVLNYFGAQVVSYPGGVAFRDEFVPAEFDLALIDIQMPEFSGFDVVQKLKFIPQFKELPVLAMTANVFIEEREKLLTFGFADFILKPFQENSLAARLGKFFPDRIRVTKSREVRSEDDFSLPYQLNDLEKFCMGDEELLQEILRDLIRDTESDLQKLKKARLNNRWEVVFEICHQLGSRLGQIKSPAGPLARKVERNLKINSKTGIQETLKILDEKARETLNALSERLGQSV